MNFQLNLKKLEDAQKVRLAKKPWLIRSLTPLFIWFFFFVPSVVSAVSLDSLLTTVRSYNYDPFVQSFCAEQNGNSLVSYRSEVQMVPASVSKLYVTDWALSVRDPQFTYKTKFYFSNGTLSIMGGNDPQFVQDDLKRVFAALTKTERSKLKKIIFDRNVVFNWQTIPNGIGTQLARVSKKYFGRTIQVRYSPLLIVKGKTRVTLTSPPLYRILKEMNVYSNNVTADSIFRDLGGSSEFKKYLTQTYGAIGSDALFETGSGLVGNLTTCRLTLAVTKHLHAKVKILGKELSDILVIPTIDPGSNKKRFLENGPSLAIKTGYVLHVQSVAGVLQTEGEPVYFSIFTYDPLNPYVPRGAALVDALVAGITQGQNTKLQPYPRKDFNTLNERILK